MWTDIKQDGTKRDDWDREEYCASELLAAAEWLRAHQCPNPIDERLAKVGHTAGVTLAKDRGQSGIGVNVIVRCTRCNAAENITEFAAW